MTAAACSLLMVEIVLSPAVTPLLVVEAVFDALADISELTGGGGGVVASVPERPDATREDELSASAKLDANA
ncbi:hypothetical protein [Lichenifustis flavocetrariae]|uniref:Uncharacterized protein n=1 Tax=Lichenifustis flavocetrariae TaxID=2949735 RepID=A0AA41YYS0_9HYPH|nr:hypothetical protein [Lichenifustis flavocetrariae]MCW6511061.1 hypothetical protein [Lichenifustis flavocetrariae]